MFVLHFLTRMLVKMEPLQHPVIKNKMTQIMHIKPDVILGTFCKRNLTGTFMMKQNILQEIYNFNIHEK